MLGKLPLSAVRGPRDTLEQCLAGESGERWLKALNQFLRGENPWPIVTKVVDLDCKITVGDGKTVNDLVQSAQRCRINVNALDVINSAQFTLDVDKASYDIVMLEFDDTNPHQTDFVPQHVFAEMRRLGLEPPSYEDILRFTVGSTEHQFRNFDQITFLHTPVRIFPDVGPGGMSIGTGEDGKIPAVLAMRFERVQDRITTVNTSLVIGKKFAARRFRSQGE